MFYFIPPATLAAIVACVCLCSALAWITARTARSRRAVRAWAGAIISLDCISLLLLPLLFSAEDFVSWPGTIFFLAGQAVTLGLLCAPRPDAAPNTP